MASPVNTLWIEVQNSPSAATVGLAVGGLFALWYRHKYIKQKNSGMGNLP